MKHISVIALGLLGACMSDPSDGLGPDGQPSRDHVEIKRQEFLFDGARWSAAYPGKFGDEVQSVAMDVYCRADARAISICVQAVDLYLGTPFEECGRSACVAGRGIHVSADTSVVFSQRSPVTVTVESSEGSTAGYILGSAVMQIAETALR